MSGKHELKTIAQSDLKLQLDPLVSAKRTLDPSHLQRRKQQRAIDDVMIKIAIAYGKKRHNKGAMLYTLTRKNLQNTPYRKWTDVLNNLTVVVLPGGWVSTAYWHQRSRIKA